MADGTPPTPRPIDPETAAQAAVTDQFFTALNPRAAVEALKELKGSSWYRYRRDRVYRIFHDSWKVYGVVGETVNALELMLQPLGFKSELDGPASLTAVTAELDRWQLDTTFRRFVAETLQTTWTNERNQPDNWYADARQLFSGVTIVHEVAEATLEAIVRMSRRAGFLWNADEPLDATDALFLEVWAPLGMTLRYRVRRHHPDPYSACRAALLHHLYAAGPPDTKVGVLLETPPLFSQQERGFVVLTDDTRALQPFLEAMGFQINDATMADERLMGRLLVTGAPERYRSRAADERFGLIAVEANMMNDAAGVATRIGAAVFDLDVWNRTVPFELLLTTRDAALVEIPPGPSAAT